jgi:hypothetical protein
MIQCRPDGQKQMGNFYGPFNKWNLNVKDTSRNTLSCRASDLTLVPLRQVSRSLGHLIKATLQSIQVSSEAVLDHLRVGRLAGVRFPFHSRIESSLRVGVTQRWRGGVGGSHWCCGRPPQVALVWGRTRILHPTRLSRFLVQPRLCGAPQQLCLHAVHQVVQGVEVGLVDGLQALWSSPTCISIRREGTRIVWSISSTASTNVSIAFMMLWFENSVSLWLAILRRWFLQQIKKNWLEGYW